MDSTLFVMNMKYLRKVKGLTQERFGDEIGFSKTAISNLEIRKSTPSLEVAMLIAKYFEVPLERMVYTDIRRANT